MKVSLIATILWGTAAGLNAGLAWPKPVVVDNEPNTPIGRHSLG
ncbi:MAG TPA: hypothetical protein PL160_01620 [Candidatus Cloacimonas sp.]|nr:hypothetical protein [Candidatus Cloacimonas sp.]